MTQKADFQKYLDEANDWDADKIYEMAKSKKRAWSVAFLMMVLFSIQSLTITTLLPLKKVEPIVIRVDNNTGMVDVVTLLKDEVIETSNQTDKYFLNKYLRHREGFLWPTREEDRNIVGLLSAASEQERYMAESDPESNPNAPIARYNQNCEVNIKAKSISILAKDDVVAGVKTHTAMVRYIKTETRTGVSPVVTHWVATITYTYINAPMSDKDRLENPLGFQVITYRNDSETGGSK